MGTLTPEQIRFFETFGYIVMPGLMKDSIGAITDDFEGLFADKGVVHDPAKRTCIAPFADQREGLCALLDHPRIEGLAASLLGDDFNYVGSDGNYYSGDTVWHSDGFHTVGKFLKIAFYLDPVSRDTGALRVIPGSHRVGDDWAAKKAGKSEELWGIAMRDVPAVSLDSQPGDVVAFDHNLMHAACGGSNRRRMFTLNLSSHARTSEEIAELEDFIAGGARFWIEHAHGDLMKATAGPGRMRHLQQAIDHEGHLPALAAQCRATMPEPARG